MDRKLNIKPLKPAPEIESLARNDRHPYTYTHKLSFTPTGHLECESCVANEDHSGYGLREPCSASVVFLFLFELERTVGGVLGQQETRRNFLRHIAEEFLDTKYDHITEDAEGNVWSGYGRAVWKAPMSELYRYAWTYRHMQSFESQWGQMVPRHVREAVNPSKQAFNYHYDAINPETGRRCPKWFEQGLESDPGEHYEIENVWLQTELVKESRPGSGGRNRAIPVALTPAQEYWHDKLPTEEEREKYVNRLYDLSKGIRQDESTLQTQKDFTSKDIARINEQLRNMSLLLSRYGAQKELLYPLTSTVEAGPKVNISSL